ncbi:SpoIIE family protein phosphatase [Streptomyces sp. ZAF1911]|uniref:ATP-binding SpoIIE family protein phosphatase n=1 Tax=Streptomyces sp. ZAF1911 TaxID=2944129 RepID=UPI00237AC7E0|nr:SpoIIE family protein phosphatase [Streptomyces sp. ZAF1911]MDD9380392.1 SpoIIE family protein phosphatase [Streptomyces sp. ZAF1911]
MSRFRTLSLAATEGFLPVTETAVAAVDSRGAVIAWSPGARMLLGYAPEDIVGRAASELLADGRLPDPARRHLVERKAWIGRVVLRHRTGYQIEADLQACPLLDARGGIQWWSVQAAIPDESDGAALALQRSLLQQRLPTLQAVDTATRYLPAEPHAGVGGDWFDVIPLSGARVALVVGDVVGHGIQASAAMGRLRTAVRTLADVDLPADELLTDLDDLIIEEARERSSSDGEIGATCLYVVYDPVSCRCTVASAGHLAPALVTPDGTVDLLDLEPGPPLGVGGVPFEATDFPVPPGSLLVLYTDGLVEARGRDVETGLNALRHALSRPAPSLHDLCDTVIGSLLPGAPNDDVALLVARTHALDAAHVAAWGVPADPAAVPDVRRRAVAQLKQWGLAEAVPTTELIVSELVTNALRHASAPIELRLIHNGMLICEVSDTSSTSPHPRRARALDEGGRGLLLVAQLCERWGTRHTGKGKTIWAEQPRPLHAPIPDTDPILAA